MIQQVDEEDKNLFALDHTLGTLTINEPFDYKHKTQHILVIQASSSSTSINQNAPDDTKFTLTINVSRNNFSIQILK